MHTAISQPRVHIPKNHVVGIYDPETGLTEIPRPSGIHFRTMGSVIQGRERLQPEEALYLLERGALDIRWPAKEGEELGRFQIEETVTVKGENIKRTYQKCYGLPMSVQAAYAVFLGMEPNGLTLERFHVYAGLKRSGYIITRAESWNETKANPSTASPTDQSTWWTELWRRLLAGFDAQAKLKSGPVVTPGLYRNYSDIYRLLNVVPFHNPKTITPDIASADADTPFRVAFNIYKPVTGFKKSAPGEPDFRIAVVSAREKSIPNIAELDSLLSCTPFSPPEPKKSLNARLLHGYRNVILAIVDSGITSYLRLSDAGFGLEEVYRRAPARGDKGGGRGRGRGRGGGRGGGGGRGRGGKS